MQIIESDNKGNPGGRSVRLFKLVNRKGLSVEIINYGAVIKSIWLPEKNGVSENIVLGYDHIDEYFSDTHYVGATIGRYANRISAASFSMGAQLYRLDRNDGENCNHGGFSGFHAKLFDCSFGENKLILRAESPDGEGGFPGNVVLTVTYHLSDENELQMDYHLSTDKRTPVNITNHTYFNLSGEDTVLRHQLRIESDELLETDESFLPTGRILKTDDIPGFDFSQYREIGKMMQMKQENIKGYNSYFIAREKSSGLKKLATLKTEKGHRSVTVFSTMPGIMLYTGDYLSGKHAPHSGVSLEAHYFPDTPNQPSFPRGIFAVENNWRETIVYRLEF